MSILFKENKNFRSFLFFLIFSSMGTGIFGIFMMWVVHSQFQNPLYTGIASFMFSFPAILSLSSAHLLTGIIRSDY